MANVESMRKAHAGMQKIQQEIIAQVTGRGIALDASHFFWNQGRPLAELPADFVHMEVRTKSLEVNTDWSRAQLEGSWNRIDRMDVHQGIDRIVESIAPRLLRPSGGFSVK